MAKMSEIDRLCADLEAERDKIDEMLKRRNRVSRSARGKPRLCLGARARSDTEMVRVSANRVHRRDAPCLQVHQSRALDAQVRYFSAAGIEGSAVIRAAFVWLHGLQSFDETIRGDAMKLFFANLRRLWREWREPHRMLSDQMKDVCK